MNVTGYTDWYAVTPHGEEWTATPEGGLTQGKDYGPYQGSWVQFFNNKIGE